MLVADHDLGALLEAAAGRGAADAGAGRGGDHHDLALEQVVAGHGFWGRGRPRARVAMMLRWISTDPPSIVSARLNRNRRGHSSWPVMVSAARTSMASSPRRWCQLDHRIFST